MCGHHLMDGRVRFGLLAHPNGKIALTLVSSGQSYYEQSKNQCDTGAAGKDSHHVCVGIKRRGVPLAERLGRLIGGIEKTPIDTGVLDINFYRDDLSTRDIRPVVNPGAIGFDVVGRDIILVDDVLYTGRTIRAALDALFDHGRPRRVQLLVLIDRGHRELPIEASFVGRHVQTTDGEIVEVKLREVDGDEQVILVERSD
jgi:pyrimidine operon attenuation protein/uracil phosphoribosyltransferase